MAGFLVRAAGQGPDESVPGGGGAVLVQAANEAEAIEQGVEILGLDKWQIIAEPYESPHWGDLK